MNEMMQYIMMIYATIAVGALLIAAYSDYKEQAVYDIVSAVFCIACAGMAFEQERYGMALLTVSICLIILSISDLPMWGGADGAIVTGLFALVGSGIWIVIFCFCLLAFVIYFWEKKIGEKERFIREKRISLVPIIAMSLPVSLPLAGWWNGFIGL